MQTRKLVCLPAACTWLVPCVPAAVCSRAEGGRGTGLRETCFGTTDWHTPNAGRLSAWSGQQCSETRGSRQMRKKSWPGSALQKSHCWSALLPQPFRPSRLGTPQAWCDHSCPPLPSNQPSNLCSCSSPVGVGAGQIQPHAQHPGCFCSGLTANTSHPYFPSWSCFQTTLIIAIRKGMQGHEGGQARSGKADLSTASPRPKTGARQ